MHEDSDRMSREIACRTGIVGVGRQGCKCEDLSMEIERWRGTAIGRSPMVAYRGLVWIVANTRDPHSDLPAQVDETLSLLAAFLEDAGSTRERLLSVQVLLRDIGDRDAFDAKWREWIGPSPDHWPQRAVYGAPLAPGLLIEIIATAARA